MSALLLANESNLQLIKRKIEKYPTCLHKLDHDGNSPLWWAVYRNQTALALFYIQSGANVNIQGTFDRFEGATILHLACYHDNKYIIRALMEKNAQIDIVNKAGLLPYQCCKSDEMKRFLTSLEECRSQGLLRDLNDQYDRYQPRSIFEVIEFNLIDKLIETVNYYAESLSITDSHGQSALWMSISFKRFEILLYLLQVGADPNIRDSQQGVGEWDRGATPLHYACFKGDTLAMRALMEKGANENAVNNEGKLPIEVCQSGDIKKYLRGLIEERRSGDLVNTGNIYDRYLRTVALFDHVEHGQFDIIKELVTNNRELVTLRDEYNGRSALWYAAYHDQTAIALYLLDEGADPNNQDTTPTREWWDSGATVLHVACSRNNLELIRVLMERGAMLDIKNNQGDVASKLCRNDEARALLKVCNASTISHSASDSPFQTPEQINEERIHELEEIVLELQSEKLCVKLAADERIQQLEQALEKERADNAELNDMVSELQRELKFEREEKALLLARLKATLQETEMRL